MPVIGSGSASGPTMAAIAAAVQPAPALSLGTVPVAVTKTAPGSK